MGNKYNVYIWIRRGPEYGMLEGEYYWSEVHRGESFIKALIAFAKNFNAAKTGCVKLEGRP